jgi:Mg-chelatase subunit ChlD
VISRLIRKLPIFLGFSLLFIVALPEAGFAGNGTFKDGKFNFCVSVRFNATDAQLAQIRTAFQNASQVLADATDGQHRFGTVTIVNNSGASQSAEYWVNAGSGRAYATFGKFGIRGEHVNLYFASNFQGSKGSDGDAFTIAHEHSHHSYGVADEYSGPGLLGLSTVDAECAATPDASTLSFCLMDNYFTRGGRSVGAGYTLNEFCVASNHDPDKDTYQQSRNKKSCWQTIAAHSKRGATAPSSLPVDAVPAGHTVGFNTGTGGLRVMLVIDKSGSMDIEQRLTLAKQGAKLFIDFLRDGDSLGIASFDCDTTLNFPLTAISGNGTKSAAKAAIDSISLGGATNIGGGVQLALSQITSQTDRSCNEIIVLLTDGDHNCGTTPESVIPGLQDAGVTVLTVAVGSGISSFGEATLQNLASQTSGKFFRVANSFGLVGLFFELFLESSVKSNGLLARAPLAISSGQVKEIQIPVESGVENAVFGIALADAADMVTLSLRSPSGAVITEATAAGNPNVEFISEPNSKAFRILAPEPGIWMMIISAGAIGNGNLEVFASAEHDGLQLNVSATKEMVVFPEAIEVQATPTFGGESVLGATVTGTVTRPDGSKVEVALFDDGRSEHADTVPSDGVYSTLFSQANGNGVYNFDIKVVSANGTTYEGESLFPFDPANTKSVPSFTRISTATAIVTGVPAVIFDVCIQDDSSRSTLQFNSTTGDYLFTRCGAGGFTLSGTGGLTIRGSLITLQHYAADRRVTANVDRSVRKATAGMQVFSLGTTFTIMDRDTTNNTCACP